MEKNRLIDGINKFVDDNLHPTHTTEQTRISTQNSVTFKIPNHPIIYTYNLTIDYNIFDAPEGFKFRVSTNLSKEPVTVVTSSVDVMIETLMLLLIKQDQLDATSELTKKYRGVILTEELGI